MMAAILRHTPQPRLASRMVPDCIPGSGPIRKTKRPRDREPLTWPKSGVEVLGNMGWTATRLRTPSWNSKPILTCISRRAGIA
jgi:hypothetical protein